MENRWLAMVMNDEPRRFPLEEPVPYDVEEGTIEGAISLYRGDAVRVLFENSIGEDVEGVHTVTIEYLGEAYRLDRADVILCKGRTIGADPMTLTDALRLVIDLARSGVEGLIPDATEEEMMLAAINAVEAQLHTMQEGSA